jgi:hypothetical protein
MYFTLVIIKKWINMTIIFALGYHLRANIRKKKPSHYYKTIYINALSNKTYCVLITFRKLRKLYKKKKIIFFFFEIIYNHGGFYTVQNDLGDSYGKNDTNTTVSARPNFFFVYVHGIFFLYTICYYHIR